MLLLLSPRKALLLLKKKRYQEQLLDRTDNQISNLERMVSAGRPRWGGGDSLQPTPPAGGRVLCPTRSALGSASCHGSSLMNQRELGLSLYCRLRVKYKCSKLLKLEAQCRQL